MFPLCFSLKIVLLNLFFLMKEGTVVSVFPPEMRVAESPQLFERYAMKKPPEAMLETQQKQFKKQ